MKRKIVLLGMLMGSWQIGLASQVSVVDVAHVALDRCVFTLPQQKNGRSDLNMDGSVHTFNYITPFLGPKTKRIGETWIQFQCIDASDEKELVEQSGIKRRGDAWVYGATPEPADALDRKSTRLNSSH